MSDALRFYLLTRQTETKSIHSKMTCKVGRRIRHRRIHTEGEPPKNGQSCINTPSNAAKKRNHSIMNRFDEQPDLTNGFSVKLFRERCQDIKLKKRQPTVGEQTLALPNIHQRCAPRLSRINLFTRPIDISFTSFLQQEMQRAICIGEDNVRFRSDLSENGKVLTVDISTVPSSEEKTTQKKSLESAKATICIEQLARQIQEQFVKTRPNCPLRLLNSTMVKCRINACVGPMIADVD